jgi:prepilin-type N-terminal cleavage/methylation domain-containing protein/prepilin-type processing-associated H-X9-DG protein
MCKLPKRRGLTLIETVVSITIIGILAAILIPAVQSVRESARRTQCQNNLRQMALAVHSHEAAHRVLPNLYYGTFLPEPRYARDEFHFHSWQTAILPQLGQGSLHDRINLSLPATDVTNQVNLNTQLAVFMCPSTSNPTHFVQNVAAMTDDGSAPTQTVGTAARSDYEAVAGVNYKPETTGSGDLSGIQFGPWGKTRYDANRNPISYSLGRLASVSDGLSNTILIGERAGRPDLYRRGKPVDPYPYSTPNTGMDIHQSAWGISTHIWWLVFNHDQAINDTNATGIYSFHGSGANVGLADGSVRFLSDTMSQETLNALVTQSAGDNASSE